MADQPITQFKTCTKCGITKPLDMFCREKHGALGRRGDCKVCHRAVVRRNHDRRARAAGKPQIGAEMKCTECGSICTRTNSNQKYCAECAALVEKRLISASAKRYIARSERARELKRLTVVRYRERHLERTRAASRKSMARPEAKERAKLRARALRARPEHAVHVRMSAGVRGALRSGKAGRKWETILGYTLADLTAHLEKQFGKGMGWHNIAEWEIDHIIPRSAFTFADENDPEFRACWALSNLAPMWAVDNRMKSGRRLTLV